MKGDECVDAVEWTNGYGRVRFQPQMSNERCQWWGGLAYGVTVKVWSETEQGRPVLYRSARRARAVARRAERRRARAAWEKV